MRASDFVQNFERRGLSAWESEALNLITSNPPPPMTEVFVQTKDGRHRGSFFASNDYVSLGESGDMMRMPLRPTTAQQVADFYGTQLPTSKMVDAIWANAPVKLVPTPIKPNPYVNLRSFLTHSNIIDLQIPTEVVNTLLAGHKKDVVISRNMPVGRVVIYGWHRPNGSRVQGRTGVHSANYLDYSHGIRLIAPMMKVDEQVISVNDVLRSPELSPLISDEGLIAQTRYVKIPPASDERSALEFAYERGTDIVLAWGQELFSWSRML